jgi:hypothetical protein
VKVTKTASAAVALVAQCLVVMILAGLVTLWLHGCRYPSGHAEHRNRVHACEAKGGTLLRVGTSDVKYVCAKLQLIQE